MKQQSEIYSMVFMADIKYSSFLLFDGKKMQSKWPLLWKKVIYILELQIDTLWTK